MVVEAIYSGLPSPVDVNFAQPDMQIMGELVQTTEYEIEYPTSLMPSVAIGETFTINSQTYTVRGNPEKVGDGYFSKVKLSKQ